MTTHQVEIGLIPIGSGALICACIFAAEVNPVAIWFYLALFLLAWPGRSSSCRSTPTCRSRSSRAARANLSGNLLLSNLFGRRGRDPSVGHLGVLRGLRAQAAFPLRRPHGIPHLYIIFLTPEGLLRLALGLIARMFYRVTAVNVDALPAKGGVLLLPNHISYIDAVILQLACRARSVSSSTTRFTAPAFCTGGCACSAHPISQKSRAPPSKRQSTRWPAAEVVCLFPEGALTAPRRCKNSTAATN